MSAAPLVTAIVPVFEAERFVGAAIESVLAQTYPHVEIVVVDDGSTDGGPGVAARYGDALRLLRQPNRGPSAARNAGIGAARGELLAFLDADDVWLPKKLQRQVDLLCAEDAVDLCVTQVQNFWEDELAQEALRFRDHPMSKPYGGYTVTGLMARRSTFERYGTWNETLRFGEDMEWFERCVNAGARFREIPQVLARRRLHRANSTRKDPEATRDAVLAFMKQRLDARRSRSS